jgi:parallel beta-helix repeat protein
MKKKLSRILALGLSLVMALALAVPVVADVTSASVDLSDDEISAEASYTIIFKVTEDLDVSAGDTITVVFPDGTDASLIDDTLGEVQIQSSAGIWGGTANALTSISAADVTTDTDDVTVDIILNDLTNDILEGASVKVVIGTGAAGSSVINPDEADEYVLEVYTSQEDEPVKSEVYEIVVPTVGGGIYFYNASMILLDTFGGSAALMDAELAGYFAKDGYTIRVEPGTYLLTGNLDIDGEDITFEAAGEAADTIIDADGNYIDINAVGVTIDGFTVDAADYGIYVDEPDITVKNCIVTDADYTGIYVDSDCEDVTIENNVIEDCGDIGIYLYYAVGTVIEGNTITGTSDYGAIYLEEDEETEILDNTITDNDAPGIYCDYPEKLLVKGNTISDNENEGIWVYDSDGNIIITENDISGNGKQGILIEDWDEEDSVILFNNIYDNDKNLENDQGDDVLAIFNWWGSDDEDDITDGIEDSQDPSVIDYDPWLSDTVETVFVGTGVAIDSDELDAEDDAGVAVATDDAADHLAAAQYVANPQEELEDALAFFDVLLNDEWNDDVDEATLRFYIGDRDAEAHVWASGTDQWVECSDYGWSAFGGYIYITVTDDTTPSLDELCGTEFAVVAGTPAPPDVIALYAPEAGADTALTNVPFTWASHEEATSYELVISANADMSSPMVKVSAAGTAYTYTGTLTDGTPYYWQVTALDGEDVVGRSDVGTFIAKAPVVPEPPVVIEPYEPPVIEPVIEIPPSPLTPGIVWAIIAIGAILVIAVIVLIVRTRRVT